MEMPARSTKPSVALLLLAAGSSSRMGQPKQLLEYEGQTLLRRAAQTALATQVESVTVVLGANAAPMRLSLAGLPVSVLENPQWEEGMASSIRIGLQHVQQTIPCSSAVLLMLCDQPLLTPQILDELIRVHTATESGLVTAQYGEQAGVPALFHQSLFPDLLRLKGAQGARQLIRQYAHQAKYVSFPGGAFDIDTPEDFTNLLLSAGQA